MIARYMNEKIFKKRLFRRCCSRYAMVLQKEQIQPSAELKENQIDPMKFVIPLCTEDLSQIIKNIQRTKILQLYLDGDLHKIISAYLSDLYQMKKSA
jgi:hypothetical protein